MLTTATLLAALLLTGTASAGSWADPAVLDACPGYSASNVVVNGSSITADLSLAGTACNVFGEDLTNLTLSVDYESENRIHVKITDATTERYEVPESVFPRPNSTGVSPDAAAINFNYTESPFSFTVYRTSTGEVLFSTASHPIIFESQYLRVKTNLPVDANIYGLGEHTNSFRLNTHDETLTLWSRDAYGVPEGTNLYGNHPVYFEQRPTGTHCVFLLNSNGMDIKINDTESSEFTTLEYNVVGGILDFYFLAGSETDPTELAKQYAEVVGRPAEVPYWGFGLHQCRFGYKNYIDVANVITNYSAANIPLETMWTDIDYMDRRRIFTVDPDYFPMTRMREVVSYLHDHDQHYILMTDPAVAYLPGEDYGPYNRGTDLNVWLKMPNGSVSLGLVWPGVTVYPDWFSANIQQYWDSEFEQFYSPETGLDIDGAWIDMNEPSNFCVYPCEDIFAQAVQQALPPPRTEPPPDPNAPIFVNSSSNSLFVSRADDYNDPPYDINNAAGELSSKTSWTNATHANGLVEYNAHNLYGTMMSVATRNALLARRPGLKTLVITRSTFAGAGASVGKWLGDNFSTWWHYRNSIAGILGFASVYQVPMVGADICGFAENTTETLCARWATLGAFYPFMRNHNADTSISQEFYLWPTVAEAARYALDIRYRLMDYIYTAFHKANTDGTPVLQPLWFKYPNDTATYNIDLQFLFGEFILVSPVTEENSTTATYYLPDDIFYDFVTLEPVQGSGANVSQEVPFTEIPVHIRGGVVLPLRAESAMTVAELRQKDFELVVAPSTGGAATGSLYFDDGISIAPNSTSEATFSFVEQQLTVTGSFDYDIGVNISRVKFLGVRSEPTAVTINNGTTSGFNYTAESQVLDVELGMAFGELSVSYTL